MKSAIVSIVLALGGVTVPATAYAQLDSTLIQTSRPIEYDRGRNVSVTERPRPDYDPLGIRRGGMIYYPRVDTGLGFSDNVYLTSNDTVSDGFAGIAPSVRGTSDWSRHQLLVSGGARLRRYFGNSPRNQDEWNGNVLGRADIGEAYSVTAEGQVARVQEDPFSGQAATTVAALSNYNRTFAGLRGQYRSGSIRAQLGYDRQTYDFNNIELTSGQSINQSDRDRDIDQLTGQVEYALSPSTAVYSQLTWNNTAYDRRLLNNGLANRDSTGFRGLVGLSIDASSFFRGTAAIGYSERNFDAPLYRDVSGVSAEARVEYFPSELTTFTLGLRRVIEDSNLGAIAAFFDNRASLRVDHELLRNLLLNAEVEYGKQDYIDSSLSADIWRVRGGGKYLMSRSLAVQVDAGYGSRDQGGLNTGRIREFQGTVSLILQR